MCNDMQEMTEAIAEAITSQIQEALLTSLHKHIADASSVPFSGRAIKAVSQVLCSMRTQNSQISDWKINLYKVSVNGSIVTLAGDIDNVTVGDRWSTGGLVVNKDRHKATVFDALHEAKPGTIMNVSVLVNCPVTWINVNFRL